MQTQLACKTGVSMNSSAIRSTNSIRGCTFRQGVPLNAVSRRSFAQASARHNTVQVRAAGLVVDVNENNFEQEVLKSDVPVLVDFWATWCGPCKLVAPSIDFLSKEFEGKLKCVKVEDNKILMEKYKVYGLPGLIVFRNGQEVDGSHREGAITRKALLEYVEKHLGLVAAK